MKDIDIDKIIDEALEIPLPEGLGERIEGMIENRRLSDARRKSKICFFSGIVAAAAMIAAVWVFPNHVGRPQDTFSDPREAAAAMQEMLTLVSGELEGGIESVNTFEKEMAEMNRTINEYINK